MLRLMLCAWTWLWTLVTVGAWASGVPPAGVFAYACVACACCGVWLLAEVTS